MTELICIVCPKGCHLRVDETNGYAVFGQGCPRGVEYGKIELTNPTRVLTSTVKVVGGTHRRCPVKTSGPIPKRLISDAMRLLDAVELPCPIRLGQVVVADLLGTEIDWIATRGL